MKKRIAYVGLSTPIGYDYKNHASETKADTRSSPNPVLDSPFGLFLLFDEIWFLTKSLCPENLRNASFVKFLDETDKIPFINEKQVNRIREKISKDDTLIYNETTYQNRLTFETVVKNLRIDWEMGLDNHTHGLSIQDTILGGNPTLDNLLFDMEIVKLLADNNIELITNSLTQCWFDYGQRNFSEIEFSEALVVDNIPNFLTPDGPYHPCVEEARENSYLKDFRKWIATQPLHSNPQELLDIKKEVEEAIRKSQDEVFLKSFKTSSHYKSVGKAMLGDAVGLVVPGASAAGSVIEETISFVKNRERRWQAFIVSLRS